MRFWTAAEAKVWVPAFDFGPQPLEHEGCAERPFHLRADFGSLPSTRLPSVLTGAVEAVGQCEWWLVWMDAGPAQWEGGNTHLYYRLRQSYEDFRLLHEAPCHVFYRDEWPDLLTFIQVGVLNLWNIHVVTDRDRGGCSCRTRNGCTRRRPTTCRGCARRSPRAASRRARPDYFKGLRLITWSMATCGTTNAVCGVLPR
jgi:hypothetical protein